MENTTPQPAGPVPVQPVSQPPTEPEQPADAAPVLAAKTSQPEDLAAAHARMHKRLTAIEIIGFTLLIFFILAVVAGVAYYHQSNQKNNSGGYSTNVYQ